MATTPSDDHGDEQKASEAPTANAPTPVTHSGSPADSGDTGDETEFRRAAAPSESGPDRRQPPRVPGRAESSTPVLGPPNIAQIYNAYGGGAFNNVADRDFANRVELLLRDVRKLYYDNRQYQARALDHFFRQTGHLQVLDVAAGNAGRHNGPRTHDTARRLDPDATVVYVDSDPVAVASWGPVVDADPGLAVLRTDARDPEFIISEAVRLGLLDTSRPAAVLMCLLWHFEDDTDWIVRVLARLRRLLAPGSWFIISHDHADGRPEDMRAVAELYAQIRLPLTLRGMGAIASMLVGYQLVEPGIVDIAAWNPDPEGEPGDETAPESRASCIYGAVAIT